MAASNYIGLRVNKDVKDAFRSLAQAQGIAESVLLKRLIDMALASGKMAGVPTTTAVADIRARTSRLYVRIRPDDWTLLRACAEMRRMAAATYVAVLLRAHLHNLTPVPKEEMLALRRAIAEVGAIGRNLNQLARMAHQGRHTVGPSREELGAVLKACDALREKFKALLQANMKSWESGYDAANP
jgi:hypothetical protein